MDLFKDIVKSIQRTKEDLSNESDFNATYDSFVVNRALSYHKDSIYYANEMNIRPHIDKKMQFQYYLNSIRSMKREFQPWVKKEKNSTLDAVKTYFGYSNRKAIDALRLLSADQIDHILKITSKGGVGNVERSRHGGGEIKRER